MSLSAENEHHDTGFPIGHAKEIFMNTKTRTPPYAILLVEDEPAIRDLIEIMLEGLPVEITSVCTADEGLLALHSQPWSLIITDVQTPGKAKGFHLATAARQHLPQVQVIVMSGYNDDIGVPLPPGVSFLAKPWRLDDFYALVTFHLA